MLTSKEKNPALRYAPLAALDIPSLQGHKKQGSRNRKKLAKSQQIPKLQEHPPAVEPQDPDTKPFLKYERLVRASFRQSRDGPPLMFE